MSNNLSSKVISFLQIVHPVVANQLKKKKGLVNVYQFLAYDTSQHCLDLEYWENILGFLDPKKKKRKKNVLA